MKPIVVFNHTLHRKFWEWLAANPTSSKHEWPRLLKHTYEEQELLLNNAYCYACVCVKLHRLNCSVCPLDWGSSMCAQNNTPYVRWAKLRERFFTIHDCEEKEELLDAISREALKVASLPLREIPGYALVTI